MRPDDVKVCVLRMEGSTGAWDSYRAFKAVGADPEMVHLNQLEGRGPEKTRRRLDDYELLALPGGPSAGDYLRPGAILAARMRDSLSSDLKAFLEQGRMVLGTSNGFQTLMELGLLPGPDGPALALASNESARFESRSVVLRHESRGRCRLSSRIPLGGLLSLPVAHAEGRLLSLDPAAESWLEEEDRVVFRYVAPEGESGYPWNPDGSMGGVAGICNADGNILGMMPMPERALSPYNRRGWTRGPLPEEGDGMAVYRSIMARVRP